VPVLAQAVMGDSEEPGGTGQLWPVLREPTQSSHEGRGGQIFRVLDMTDLVILVIEVAVHRREVQVVQPVECGRRIGTLAGASRRATGSRCAVSRYGWVAPRSSFWMPWTLSPARSANPG
jgi:hypothetical protein